MALPLHHHHTSCAARAFVYAANVTSVGCYREPASTGETMQRQITSLVGLSCSSSGRPGGGGAARLQVEPPLIWLKQLSWLLHCCLLVCCSLPLPLPVPLSTGCGSPTSRALAFLGLEDGFMTRERCFALAKMKGYKYAALQWVSACFGGNDISLYLNPGGSGYFQCAQCDGQCSALCSGNTLVGAASSTTCGGWCANNIFQWP